jgi:DNA-binding response OmpR family regulator
MAKRILVVDDEPHILRLLKDALTRRGYEVVGASSGEQAIALAQEEPPALIFMDVMMPGMSGLAATRAIRATEGLADVPIFLLTARGQEQDVQDGMEAGADEYLTKPFSPRQLAQMVDEKLGGA